MLARAEPRDRPGRCTAPPPPRPPRGKPLRSNGDGQLSLWGKIIGGVAGFMTGGPLGAVMGAALGHAADRGGARGAGGLFGRPSVREAADLAAMLGSKEQLFAISVVVLAAKLAKCDGP